MREEFLKAVRNGKYEVTEDGLFLPAQKVLLGGAFKADIIHPDGGVDYDGWGCNIIVDEGLNHSLDVILHGEVQVSPWYVGLFEANYTPQSSDTAANIASNATESTAYDESARVEYNEAAAASKVTTNTNNKAQFTINATKTMYGAFLVSNSTKGGTTGTLLSAAQFNTARSVVSGDILEVTYSVSAQDV